jgi:hypothetical protein
VHFTFLVDPFATYPCGVSHHEAEKQFFSKIFHGSFDEKQHLLDLRRPQLIFPSAMEKPNNV